MKISQELNAITTIAFRDFTKFLRDRGRIVASFIFPVIFIGVLGSSLQSSLGANAGFDFKAFTFTGVLAQTLFQSTASGIISLISDRENDFAQELFISPVSRYSIILGKIVGESMVALTQSIGIIIFGLIIGVSISLTQLLWLIPAAVLVCLFGGAFGVLVLSNIQDQRTANQIFPFIIFPQYFLAGIFAPVKELPVVLTFLSRISPMTYAVDFVRNLFFAGQDNYKAVLVYPLTVNLLVIAVMFVLFIFVGTFLFVRNERNR